MSTPAQQGCAGTSGREKHIGKGCGWMGLKSGGNLRGKKRTKEKGGVVRGSV